MSQDHERIEVLSRETQRLQDDLKEARTQRDHYKRMIEWVLDQALSLGANDAHIKLMEERTGVKASDHLGLDQTE